MFEPIYKHEILVYIRMYNQERLMAAEDWLMAAEEWLIAEEEWMIKLSDRVDEWTK